MSGTIAAILTSAAGLIAAVTALVAQLQHNRNPHAHPQDTPGD